MSDPEESTDDSQSMATQVAWTEFGHVISDSLKSHSEAVVYCRDREVDRLITNFDHGRHKSILLVGPSGCGKSSIYHEFFRRISRRDESPWTIVATSSSRILDNTEYLGQWQTRLFKLVSQARADDRVALFWSGITAAISAGRSSQSEENVALAMAPHLESGELIIFGECTDEAFQKRIKPHTWFEKLLTVIRIEPQPDETIRKVVHAVAEARGKQFRDDTLRDIRWTEEVLESVCDFGKTYFPGTVPPGGAIQLLDHVLAVKSQDDVGDDTLEVTQVIGRTDLVPILESVTGLSAKLLDDTKPLKGTDVRHFFDQRVIGQPHAVKAIVDLIMLIKAGLTDPEKPLGVLLFYGPTGVGKTELAKALAEFLFGTRERMIRLDMSEYQNYHAVEKIVGSPRFNQDQEGSAGHLLRQVRSQPFSVILLDEIEKANPAVFDLFLQLFDDGRLSDAEGETTHFTQTIVIMTSNLGGEISDGTALGFVADKATDDPSEDLESVHRFFRPELINRIDQIIKFRPLDRVSVRTIAQRELGQVLMRSGITRRHLRIDVDPGVVDLLAKEGFDAKLGARPLKRAVQRLVLMPLARELAQSTADHRPALIQLQPTTKSVSMKIIHDRQTRKSESIEKGVQIRNRAGKRTRVKPKEIEQAFNAVRQGIRDLESEFESRDLPTLKSELVAQTNEVGFWDNPAQARDTMTEIYRIERLTDAIQKLSRRVQGLQGRYRKSVAGSNERAVAEVAQEIVSVMRHLDVVGYSMRCSNRLDRSDAFVTITAVDDVAQDVVGHLADMYANWAKRKGFVANIVHEELFTPKRTREVILMIEGVAIVGLLRTEDGLHEFISGKNAKSAQQRHFVNVRVSPIVDDHHLEQNRIHIERKAVRGGTLRSERIRGHYLARDKKEGVEAELRTSLNPAEAKITATEYLNACIRRRDIIERAEQGGVEESPVVRRYTLKPSQSAKDTRTDVVMHNLRELWKGALDAFLVSNVARRTQD